MTTSSTTTTTTALIAGLEGTHIAVRRATSSGCIVVVAVQCGLAFDAAFGAVEGARWDGKVGILKADASRVEHGRAAVAAHHVARAGTHLAEAAVVVIQQLATVPRDESLFVQQPRPRGGRAKTVAQGVHQRDDAIACPP